MPTTDLLDRIPLKYNGITLKNGEDALELLDQLQKLQDHPHQKELKNAFQMVYYMFMFNYGMIEIWQKQYSKLCTRSFNSLYFILFLSILFHRTVYSRFLHGFLFNIYHIIYHQKALIPLFLMRWLSKCHFCILHYQAFFTFLTFSSNMLAISNTASAIQDTRIQQAR